MRVIVLALFISICTAQKTCDWLSVLPCNQSIKTCYIHENVCSATDVLFTAFDGGWTFLFVMYPIVNATRCTETAGVMTPMCLTPTGMTTMPKQFLLSVVAQQGLHASTTITTLPPIGDKAILKFLIPPIIATSGLTSVLLLNVGDYVIQNMIFNGTGLSMCILSGTANSLTITNSVLNGCTSGIGSLADVTIRLGSVTAILAASPTLAFLLVLSGCINCNVTSTAGQYIALDYRTTSINVVGAVVFNVSAIIKMEIALPDPAGPPICQSVSCAQSTLAIAAEAIGISISGIIILVMIRRHYVTAHAEKEQ